MSKLWRLTGFSGINNVQDPTAIEQPSVDAQGSASGAVQLTDCINFDIDDSGGLIQRDESQAIFDAEYDAKLTQTLGGRTFTASGRQLRYTKPWSDEEDSRRSVIEYVEQIVLIQEVEVGMWISTTEKIFYHSGRNPTVKGGFAQTQSYDFRAIAGTGEKVHRSKLGLDGDGFVAIFATVKGICYGEDNGNLVNISEGIYSYEPAYRGISYVKEENGLVQYQVRLLTQFGGSFNPFERKNEITVDTV